MKKKIIFPVVFCLMAGLTVLNLGLANRADNTDTTLDLISVMAQAYDEGEGGHIVTVDCWDTKPSQAGKWSTTQTLFGVEKRNCLAENCAYQWIGANVNHTIGECTFIVGPE